jgi:hypothetical protein
MNSLVFSRSRRTGGSAVWFAAASLLRMGALTSARESMDLTNSAGKVYEWNVQHIYIPT